MTLNRIKYLDTIKGITIYLVVMGHCLAWCFDNYIKVYEQSSPQAMIIWRIIYSFHMPLFFFISGFLFKKQIFSKALLAKKALHLLVPYFTMGFIKYLYLGDFGYWFLMVLFELYILACIQNLIINDKNNTQNHRYIIISIIIFLVLYIINKYVNINQPVLRHLYIDNLFRNYPYFILGHLIYRYNFQITNNYLYTTSLILFITITTIEITSNIATIPAWGILCLLRSCCGIYVIMYLVKNYLNKENLLTRLFQYLGTYTLEIYVIHFFFKYKIPDIGNIILNYNSFSTSFIIQSVYAIIATSFIIGISTFIINILNKSSLINLLCFGKK